MLRILHGDVSSHYVHCKLKLGTRVTSVYIVFILQGLYIWVSKDAPQALIQKIFGVTHFGAIPEIMVCMLCCSYMYMW